MKIGLDLDGVCADFDAGISLAYKRSFGTPLPKSDTWDAILENTHFSAWSEIYAWLETVPNFWRSLESLKGWQDGVESLLHQGHEIVVITHRPDWATGQTVGWVRDHWPTGDFPDVVLTQHKQTVTFDVLIDDGPHNVAPVLESGRDVILFDQPWNAHVESSENVRRAHGWDHVVELCAPPVIVGLMGYAQSGKDSSANLLSIHGFRRIAFADALRDCLYALNPIVGFSATVEGENSIDADEIFPTRLRSVVNAGGWDAAKQIPEVRSLLQLLGTEVGREILGKNIWVDTAMKKAKSGNKYVITDVRFPNEAHAIRAQGGKLFRVIREGYGPVNDHPSEIALDDQEPDGYIHNHGTMDDLKAVINRTVEAFSL